MLRQVRAALLHFDEDDGLPDVVGEAGAAAVFGGLTDAHLGGAAEVERALLAEGAEEAVEEDLALARAWPFSSPVMCWFVQATKSDNSCSRSAMRLGAPCKSKGQTNATGGR